MSESFVKRSLSIFSISLTASLAFAGTNFLSDQLPVGKTLEDYGLGTRLEGSLSRQVRAVELATLPNSDETQQISARGNSLYLATRQGRVWQYDLESGLTAEPFLDLTSLGTSLFYNAAQFTPSRGLRGFAFHPEFETNGLVYTMQKVLPDGSVPDYGKPDPYAEYLCVEWNYNAIVNQMPTMRVLFRVRFEHDFHPAQHLVFNPTASPGDSDYGMMYAGFGDNGTRTGGVRFDSQIREVNDVSNVGQDFDTIHAGVIRIHPLDPSAKSDLQLAAEGLKRAQNGNFSIPLDNPYIGRPNHKEELYAKGFRNPLTFSFSPLGSLIVADVGEQSMEEINVLVNGGNYGWPIREGTFLVAWADQIDGSPIGSDDSMVWIPSGEANDPAATYWVRDKDQTNPRQETLARSGPFDDGFEYPVFQFSHEGNATTETTSGLSAVAGGDFYTGFWAEELEGLYLFSNISTDQIFFGDASLLDAGVENAEVQELPLVDANGASITLASIIGNSRANLRFGKDAYGNLYFASKTNGRLYRLQGTPELNLKPADASLIVEGENAYFEFTLDRPPNDGSIDYKLMVTTNLTTGFAAAEPADYQEIETTSLPSGKERVRYRYLSPVTAGAPRFFKISWE